MMITVTQYKIAEVFLLCHAICASSSVIVIRRLTQGPEALHPLIVSTYSFIVGTVVMFLTFIVTWLTYIPWVTSP
jgi:uncharacterized membrane protein YdcZ (DUF606 family)